MAYVAVSDVDFYGRTIEKIFQNKPKKYVEKYQDKIMTYWVDKTEYDRQRGYSTDANDGSIILPNGTIEKLIGHVMYSKNKPIKL